MKIAFFCCKKFEFGHTLHRFLDIEQVFSAIHGIKTIQITELAVYPPSFDTHFVHSVMRDRGMRIQQN